MRAQVKRQVNRNLTVVLIIRVHMIMGIRMRRLANHGERTNAVKGTADHSTGSSSATITFKRTYQERNIWDDPIIEESQDQDQGQGQDEKVQQRSALRQQMVLALPLTLVLLLRFFNYRVVPDIPSLISSLE